MLKPETVFPPLQTIHASRKITVNAPDLFGIMLPKKLIVQFLHLHESVCLSANKDKSQTSIL